MAGNENQAERDAVQDYVFENFSGLHGCPSVNSAAMLQACLLVGMGEWSWQPKSV